MILFINNKPARCGVYQFGRNIRNLLQNKEGFAYEETNNQAETEYYINKYKPDFIIYNYHPTVTTWLSYAFARKYRSGITAHDQGQNWPGVLNIYLDPDYEENGENYRICRPIPEFTRKLPVIENSIGAFGFGFGHKKYEHLVRLINNEFDEAVIRLHIPYSTYCDSFGHSANYYAQRCREENKKPGIKIEISHEYLSEEDLANWLSQNSINCFIFEDVAGSSGCSSSTDWAIAVRQPIAISNNIMFRHLRKVNPPIYINRGLKVLIDQGFGPIAKVTDNWNKDTLWDDFQRIARHQLT